MGEAFAGNLDALDIDFDFVVALHVAGKEGEICVGGVGSGGAGEELALEGGGNGVVEDGIFAIVAGVRAPKEMRRWWILLIEGIVGVAAGIIAFIMPGMTALILLILIASWSIITGVIEIVAAIQLRKQITGEWLMALMGIASIAFGGLLLYDPAAGAVALIWIIGIYAILFGVLLIALGFKLRGVDRSVHGAQPHPA